jgi:IS30 family transposase
VLVRNEGAVGSNPITSTADRLETPARSMGHRNALLMIGMIIPRSKEREMTRKQMSLDEVEEMWDRYRRGETVAMLARRFDRTTSGIGSRIRQAGGIRPHLPCRAERHLTLAEREEISRGLAADESFRQIAGRLDRAPSTVSREVAANGGRKNYRAVAADQQATQRRRRPKVCKLAGSPRLRQLVNDRLEQKWSPEQISGWLARTHPDDPELQVSHETIYRTLYVQSRGVLKAELARHLRTRRHVRRPTASNQPRRTGRSVTWDQGIEMAQHAQFSIDTDVQVYFCDPHSPWQRGTNENTNGLLRQYFPKGTSLKPYSPAYLDAVAKELNARPRKTLDQGRCGHPLRAAQNSPLPGLTAFVEPARSTQKYAQWGGRSSFSGPSEPGSRLRMAVAGRGRRRRRPGEAFVGAPDRHGSFVDRQVVMVSVGPDRRRVVATRERSVRCCHR